MPSAPTPRRFLFLKASARTGGNTEALARAAALPDGAEAVWRDLTQPALPPFEDLRHGAGYGAPEAHAAVLSDETRRASDIVFVAPLYWYGLPAPAKLYLDHWSHWMRLDDGFKAAMAEKTIWLVMAHSGSSPEQTRPAVDSLRFSAEYFGARWGGALLGLANRPGQIAEDTEALMRAQRFFTA